jgi:hypothetical protein
MRIRDWQLFIEISSFLVYFLCLMAGYEEESWQVIVCVGMIMVGLTLPDLRKLYRFLTMGKAEVRSYPKSG